MAITCKWCGRHVPRKTYGEAWATFLKAKWGRDEVRAKSPSCEICADQFIKSKKLKETP